MDPDVYEEIKWNTDNNMQSLGYKNPFLLGTQGNEESAIFSF